MITIEDIEAFQNDEVLVGIMPDIKRALQAAESCMHYLHETSNYESEELDRACYQLDDTIKILRKFSNA